MIQNSSHYKKSGNILFILLIAIALFAGLTLAITQSGKNSGGAKKEKAALIATEIMEYAGSVKIAVQKLLFKGCDDTQISFERSPFDGSDTNYVNPNAPTSKKCHVFHPNGGGINYKTPTDAMSDSANSGETDYQKLVFTSSCVQYIGSSSALANCNGDSDDSPYTEILLIIPYLKQSVCEQINKKLENSTIITQDVTTIWNATSYFQGTHLSTVFVVGDHDHKGSRASFCVEGDVTPPAGTYHYYHVLVAR